MKKIICIILSVLLILSGCASDETNSNGNPTDAYKNAAQDKINEGNIDEAISILDVGIGLYDDAALKQMKEELLTSQNVEGEDAASSDVDAPVEGDVTVGDAEADVEASVGVTDTESKTEAEIETDDAAVPEQDDKTIDETENETESETESETEVPVADKPVIENKTEEKVDYAAVAQGTWSGNDMTINIVDGEMAVYYESVSQNQRVATIEQTYPMSLVVDNIARVSFEDSWCNIGTLFIEFSNELITVEMETTNGGGLWGVGNGTFELKRKSSKADEWQPTDVDLVELMTDEERREVNIFLSNFSEAGFTSYGYDESDLNQSLLNFAFLHNKINVPSRIGTDYDQVGNCYYTISSTYVDSTLNKFFGHSIPHQSYCDIDLVGDDSYHFSAADGQSHSYFSNVVYMTYNGDGEYYVEFGVFYDAYAEGVMSHWYNYTWEQAYANCELVCLGEAVLSEKYENGIKSYEVEEYIVYM